jgi:membrane associated rhomboid family serine protease
LWFAALQLTLAALTYYAARDEAYCVVSGITAVGGGDPRLNGYYRGNANNYIKIGDEATAPSSAATTAPAKGASDTTKLASSLVVADVFRIFSLRRKVDWSRGIFTSEPTGSSPQSWSLRSKSNNDAYFFTPASSGLSGDWKSVDVVNDADSPNDKDDSSVRVAHVHCVGTLANSAAILPRPRSNLQYLAVHPVTTILIGLITAYAYYLFDRRVDVSTVSFSYATCIQEKQYWRAITASFAHFDIMHFGFNTMSVYQLAQLEIIYGSVAYGYLSFALIFITIGICGIVSWFFIQTGRTDFMYQQSVGYSCVLFAWMVAISVRMPVFCPITFFPQLCFATWSIPVPFLVDEKGAGLSIPINLGPIVLLFITKVIIPRSSFLGHLSGILIGYPLAWNCLNWLTPPVLCALAALFVLWDHGVAPGKFNYGFTNFSSVGEFVDTVEIKKFKLFGVFALLVTGLSIVFLALCVNSTAWNVVCPVQVFLRVIITTLIAFSAQGRVCLWYTETRDPAVVCAVSLVTAAAVIAVISVYDLCSFAAGLASYPFVSATSVGQDKVLIIWFALSTAETVLFASYVLVMADISQVQGHLKLFRLEEASVTADLTTCRMLSLLQELGILRRSPTSRLAFSGVPNRLHSSVIADAESQQLLPHDPVGDVTAVSASASTLQSHSPTGGSTSSKTSQVPPGGSSIIDL